MPSASLPVVRSPEADEDLIEIWAYLAHEASDRVADNQLRDIEKACSTLKNWPYSGRKRDELLPGLRSIPVHPYIVFYRVREDAVEIVRVLHGRRDIDSIFAKLSDT
jgi:toxin ParE1/3/4